MRAGCARCDYETNNTNTSQPSKPKPCATTSSRNQSTTHQHNTRECGKATRNPINSNRDSERVSLHQTNRNDTNHKLAKAWNYSLYIHTHKRVITHPTNKLTSCTQAPAIPRGEVSTPPNTCTGNEQKMDADEHTHTQSSIHSTTHTKIIHFQLVRARTRMGKWACEGCAGGANEN